MIARHEKHLDKNDLWSALAAPLPAGVVAWRQDGRAIQRDGKWYARFVAYIDANTVRERLDAIVPGEWDLTLDLLPPTPGEEDDPARCFFKARLQILGVIREDVGTGRDYKAAATDAFKRAAVRFGIGYELYAMEQNWVQVDGEGRSAKPLEDPQAAYDRRHGNRNAKANGRANGTASANGAAPSTAEDRAYGEPLHPTISNGATKEAAAERAANAAQDRRPPAVATTQREAEEQERRATAPPAKPATTLDAETVRCPKCDGQMWDNRATKRNPKAPDFKCRDRSCDGVIWPPREPKREPDAIAADGRPEFAGDDEIPF